MGIKFLNFYRYLQRQERKYHRLSRKHNAIRQSAHLNHESREPGRMTNMFRSFSVSVILYTYTTNVQFTRYTRNFLGYTCGTRRDRIEQGKGNSRQTSLLTSTSTRDPKSSKVVIRGPVSRGSSSLKRSCIRSLGVSFLTFRRRFLR